MPPPRCLLALILVTVVGLTATGLWAEQPLAGQQLLYATNDITSQIDVFDVAAEHRIVRSFPIHGRRAGGICADAKSGRVFVSQQNEDTVTAYDAVSGRVLWQINTLEKFGGGQPDRLTITRDGRAVYVPLKKNDRTLVLDAATGGRLAEFDRPGRPHNSWTGESGRHMYVAGRSHPTMYVTDQQTHQVVREIGPFSSPIRPFSIDREERYLFANLTLTLGFGVGDIATGKVLQEVVHSTPAERKRHASANGGRPHGDNPYSHGIAIRPGTTELWWMDDEWGYLYIHDFAAMPVKFSGQVELFSRIDQPWGYRGNRWVSFSIDGRYCYPSDGSVIDAVKREKTKQWITPSEKMVQIDFVDGKAVRVSGQMGGVY